MLNMKRTEEVLNQVFPAPVTPSTSSVLMTMEQLTRLTELAYLAGHEDVLSVLRRPELGSTGAMIADAVQTHLTANQENLA